MKKDWSKEVEEGAMKKVEKEAPSPIKKGDLLSTGSTLLNLALSGRTYGGLLKGKYFNFTGDSGSGKTFLAICALAEACQNENFNDYRLIYDNVEDGMLMNVEKLFGGALADRIEPPALNDDGEPKFSDTIEDFYYNVDDAQKEEKPFIYVLDSMDGLTSREEEELFDKNKKAHRKGTKLSGTYGDGKAKKNSTNLRTVVRRLTKTGSILIILSQAKELMNAMPFQDNKTRAGGKALRYYATAEIWSALGGSIKKEVRGKKRKLGDEIVLKIKKNRITGKLWTVSAALYPSYGLDDIGNCIDFLVDEGHWKKTKGTIVTKNEELGNGTRDTLISVIEENGNLKTLRKEVLTCWKELEKETSLQRKPRYA